MARWRPSGLESTGASGASVVKACPSVRGWVILGFRMRDPHCSTIGVTTPPHLWHRHPNGRPDLIEIVQSGMALRIRPLLLTSQRLNTAQRTLASALLSA